MATSCLNLVFLVRIDLEDTLLTNRCGVTVAQPDGRSVGTISMACIGRVNLGNNLRGTCFVYNYLESFRSRGLAAIVRPPHRSNT